MKEKIEAYVHGVFAPYKEKVSARELGEELIQNLSDKYDDYKQQGYSDEESYQWTVDSIGDVSELVATIDPYHDAKKEKLYGSFSNGLMAASVYAMLFVALMVVFRGTITSDTLVLPAVVLMVVISLVQYVVKGTSRYPRWLVIGSFVTAIIVAVGMTIIFH